jgi:hypothetical protein
MLACEVRAWLGLVLALALALALGLMLALMCTWSFEPPKRAPAHTRTRTRTRTRTHTRFRTDANIPVRTRDPTTSPSTSASAPYPIPPPTAAVAVFNCNRVLAHHADRIAQLLDRCPDSHARPSIAMLQELPFDEDVRALRERGWTVVARDPVSELAIAIRSDAATRWAAESVVVERMPESEFFMNAAVLARLRHASGARLCVMSVHLASTEYLADDAERCRETEWLIARMRRHGVDVVGGDWNSRSHLDRGVGPGLALDHRAPSHLMQEAGYVDLGANEAASVDAAPQKRAKHGAGWARGTWLPSLDSGTRERIDRIYARAPLRGDVWTWTPDVMGWTPDQWPTGPDHAALYALVRVVE